MLTKIIEVTNNDQNWGKFMLLKPDTEWSRMSLIDPLSKRALLSQLGWTPNHVWVLDLQTGEGAFFLAGGHASADLNKHKIWVCPLFEPFLQWLYLQGTKDIKALPDMVNLPDAPFAVYGYRRTGNADR